MLKRKWKTPGDPTSQERQSLCTAARKDVSRVRESGPLPDLLLLTRVVKRWYVKVRNPYERAVLVKSALQETEDGKGEGSKRKDRRDDDLVVKEGWR